MKKNIFLVFLISVLQFVNYSCKNKDILLSDFEESSYGPWTVEGEAFGDAPAFGSHVGKSEVAGYLGKGFANSFANGDEPMGKLISPELTINRNYLVFYIGGGNSAEKVCLNLIVEGEIVATSTGEDNESLSLRTFDLQKWKGKKATIEIVDQSSSNWGHISVDHIVLTDYPSGGKPYELEMKITQDYFNVPLSLDKETPKYKMHVEVDNKLIGIFDVPFGITKVDYYGFLDFSNYRGKTLTVKIDKFNEDFEGITLDNKIKGSENLYNETHRPQLHFSTKRGWINDPNGLIYHEGKYHLYYQYNPFGVRWGNISWGHATSTDMIHWEEQPAVLYPLPETGKCYSGATFIDEKNQLGLKKGDEDVIVAFYLRTKIGLSYAYSNDGGQSMTDYEGNPVLNHKGARIDTPRPFWHEPTKRWIAPTYDFYHNEDGEKLRCVGIYSSEDLKEWKFESSVKQNKWGDELCGCVDFFQLPVDGDTEQLKWVMILIDGSYIIGEFDGHVFYTLDGKPATTEDRITSLVKRGNYYATMTWHNMPDYRRVQVTWMNGPQYSNMPFSQQMTLPVELTLHSSSEGPRLKIFPIAELSKLRKNTVSLKDVGLNNSSNPLSKLSGDLYELNLELEPEKNSITVLNARGVKITYDASVNELSCNGIKAQISPNTNGKINLQIFIDRTSVEVFANNGQVYIPLTNLMPLDKLGYSLNTLKGNAKVTSIDIHELKSIWF